jgi:hypothetical protein
MEMSLFAMQQSPIDSLIQDIEMFGRGIRRPTNEEFEQHKVSVKERFNSLSADEQQNLLQMKPEFAGLVGRGATPPSSFQGPPGLRAALDRFGRPSVGGTQQIQKMVGGPARMPQQMGGIANLQRRFQPPMQQQGAQSIMGRLENVDNNVQQIARQLGVQNQPQRPNLPSAMQTMQGPPQGILALLQRRQQQAAQADPLLLQQNQLAAQSRLQPRYNPQAQMLMQQQAVPSQALQALQSRQAYRGLAAGPFAFSMRR